MYLTQNSQDNHVDMAYLNGYEFCQMNLTFSFVFEYIGSQPISTYKESILENLGNPVTNLTV